MNDVYDNEFYYFKVIDKEGKCYGKKLDDNRYTPISDTYSTLLHNYLNSGGIISDNEYCVDCCFDDDLI